MSPWAWAVVLVLAAAVVWLVFAMIGLVREVAALRAELASRPSVQLAGGLPVGSAGPPWTIETPEGPVASAGFAGERHLLVFADGDCRACDDVVPAVVREAGADRLPPAVVIGRNGAPTPGAWSGPNVAAGRERERDVSDAYLVDASPHVFVIDEQGAVVAQGGAVSLADVVSLVRDAEGIRIVPGVDDA
jgi:hypothetical protein